jgi:hypothetical protein
MPGIEDLLREELQRVTDAVQREHLRPLRAPARRQRWQRRLIPLAAAAAVIAIITVAALMTGLPSGRQAAPSSLARPPYRASTSRASSPRAAMGCCRPRR